MTHIVLLGDSIFDNAPYVDVEEDVIHYLKRKIPLGWKATLLAIDGSITTDLHAQVQKLPKDSTHLFLSVGGNDALRNIGRCQIERWSESAWNSNYFDSKDCAASFLFWSDNAVKKESAARVFKLLVEMR